MWLLSLVLIISSICPDLTLCESYTYLHPSGIAAQESLRSAFSELAKRGNVVTGGPQPRAPALLNTLSHTLLPASLEAGPCRPIALADCSHIHHPRHARLHLNLSVWLCDLVQLSQPEGGSWGRKKFHQRTRSWDFKA